MSSIDDAMSSHTVLAPVQLLTELQQNPLPTPRGVASSILPASVTSKMSTRSKLPPPTPPSNRPQEKQIMPGVYFTPPPSTHVRPPVPGEKPMEQMTLPELKHEYDELSKSVKMLLSSNEEMRKMDPGGEDSDLNEAVSGNCAIVTRRRIRIGLLDERIRLLGSGAHEGRAQTMDGGVYL